MPMPIAIAPMSAKIKPSLFFSHAGMFSRDRRCGGGPRPVGTFRPSQAHRGRADTPSLRAAVKKREGAGSAVAAANSRGFGEERFAHLVRALARHRNPHAARALADAVAHEELGLAVAPHELPHVRKTDEPVAMASQETPTEG